MIWLGIVDRDAEMLLQAVLCVNHEASCKSDDTVLLHLGRDVRKRPV